MAKIFRNIRFSLLFKNKTKKYLQYAIGEILLVMIGILLALQVNNWNERSKSNSIQRRYMQKLKLDVSKDIDRFIYLDSIYEGWDKEVDFILNEVLTGTRDSLNSHEEYGIGRGSFYYITLKKTIYNEMLNTGIFYQLESPEMETSIREYYEIAEFELTKLNRDNQNHANYFLSPLLWEQKNLNFRLLRKRNLDNINWSWLKDPNSDQYKEFENRVIWFDYAIIANKSVLLELKNKAQNVIQEIDKYLK